MFLACWLIPNPYFFALRTLSSCISSGRVKLIIRVEKYIHFNKKAEGMKTFGRPTHRSMGNFKKQM
jgi:hypothetical protein